MYIVCTHILLSIPSPVCLLDVPVHCLKFCMVSCAFSLFLQRLQKRFPHNLVGITTIGRCEELRCFVFLSLLDSIWRLTLLKVQFGYPHTRRASSTWKSSRFLSSISVTRHWLLSLSWHGVFPSCQEPEELSTMQLLLMKNSDRGRNVKF